MSKIYDYFPGGNTSKGFYSFYRYIMSQNKAKRIFCIKGGPGTGKSSLMKKIGNYYLQKGYDIEFHHCSSDNNSLDGVVIKGLDIVLLDGTAPHVVDPINPGAVDEILNMGECWDVLGFEKYRKSIIDCNKKVGHLFKSGYRYISAAKLIHDDLCFMYSSCMNYNALNTIKEDLKNSILNLPISNLGVERHMFATAFTPNGIITYIDNLCQDINNIYILKGEPGTGKSDILEYLYKEALRRGLYVEIFHTPLKPERIEHIIIPELNTAVLTKNEITDINIPGKIIDLNQYLNPSISSYGAKIKEGKKLFYELLNKGLSFIKNAKSEHDILETFYIPNMNFKKTDEVFNNIIKRISYYESKN